MLNLEMIMPNFVLDTPIGVLLYAYALCNS